MLSRHTLHIFKLDASLPFYSNTLFFYLRQQTTYPIFQDLELSAFLEVAVKQASVLKIIKYNQKENK
jgi:hypothetical protein